MFTAKFFSLISLIALISASGNMYCQSSIDSITLIDPFAQEFRVKQLIRKHFFSERKGYREIDSLQNVISKAGTAMDGLERIRLSLSLVDAYVRKGQYTFATREAFNAMREADRLKDTVMQGLVFIKLGNVYYVSHYGEYNENLLKGLALIGDTDNEELAAYCYYTKGKIEQDTAKSNALFRKALDLQRKIIKIKPNSYEAKENLGKYLNANGLFEEAIAVSESIGGHYFTLYYLNNLGYLKYSRKDFAGALKVFTRAWEICKHTHLSALLRNIFAHFSALYRLMGDQTKALQYLELQLLSEECLYEERYENQYAEFTAQYEVDKKNKELTELSSVTKELNERIEFGFLLRYILFGFILGLSLLVVGLLYGRKKLNNAKLQIEEERNNVQKKNEELEQLHAELTESERYLKAAQFIAKLATWELLISEQRFTFSDELPKLLNVTSEELRRDYKNTILSKVYPDDAVILENYLTGNIGDGGPKERILKLLDAGPVRWLKIDIFFVASDKNNSLLLRGTVHDVTLQKEEEEAKVLIAAQQSFTRQLLEAQEVERRRIASELHDGLGQDILLLKNIAQLGIKNKLTGDYAINQLHEINNTAAALLQEVREISYNLVPVHLSRIGLTETISEAISKMQQSSNISVETEIENIDAEFSSDKQLNVFRIIQESLNNIVKHANASVASVSIKIIDTNVMILIKDNGRGMIHDYIPGIGLNSIKSRVELLEGTVLMKNSEGSGLVIEIVLPSDNI